MINRPRTDAGRLALVFYDAKPRTPQSRASGRELIAAMADHILAIEAEMDAEHAATVERLRKAIEILPVHYRRNGFAGATAWVTRRDVLLAIRAALSESQP